VSLSHPQARGQRLDGADRSLDGTVISPPGGAFLRGNGVRSKEDRMNVPCFRLLLASLITVSALAANREAAAAAILIEATPTVTWRSGGMESGGENAPLIIQATAGDVLEIRVVGGPHGFVTIDKPGNQSPSSAVKFVQACGESAQDKPDAVFREIECSRF